MVTTELSSYGVVTMERASDRSLTDPIIELWQLAMSPLSLLGPSEECCTALGDLSGQALVS